MDARARSLVYHETDVRLFSWLRVTRVESKCSSRDIIVSTVHAYIEYGCDRRCTLVGRPLKDGKTKKGKEILGSSNFKNKAFFSLYVTLYPKSRDHKNVINHDKIFDFVD